MNQIRTIKSSEHFESAGSKIHAKSAEQLDSCVGMEVKKADQILGG